MRARRGGEMMGERRKGWRREDEEEEEYERERKRVIRGKRGKREIN